MMTTASASPTPSPLLRGLLVTLALLACALVSFRIAPLLEAWWHAEALSLAALLVLLCLAVGLALAALRASHRTRPGGRSLRLALILLGCVPVAIAALSPHADARWTDLLLGGAACGLALLACTGGRIEGGGAPRLLRWSEGLLLPALLTLGLVEGGLRLAALVVPHPIFSRAGGDTPELVRNLRLQPGSSLYGYAVNSGGYPDEETPTDARERIALVGDSFGVSMVPWSLHHATEAERLLFAAGRPTALQNIAVPGIGLPEYAHLLRKELPGLRAELAIVTVFVGNDLEGPGLGAHRGAEDERLFQRDRWFLWRVVSRLMLLARDAEEGGQHAAVGEGPPEASRVRPYPVGGPRPWTEAEREAYARAHFPAAVDPTLEVATATSARLLEIERERLLATARPGAIDGQLLRQRLRELVEAAAPVPLAVVVLPDRYQIDDSLWEQLQRDLGTRGQSLLRDGASQGLLQACRDLEIPVLDLTPKLRAAREAQPERRLFHLGDTHLNAAGSRILGQALAAWILEDLSAP